MSDITLSCGFGCSSVDGCQGHCDNPKLQPDTYRGWAITWDYGYYTATSPNYDASYEGEEDGWVDNGQRVQGRTRADACAEVDAWFEDNLS